MEDGEERRAAHGARPDPRRAAGANGHARLSDAGRVLLLLPKTSYRTDAFLAAARALGAEVLVGSNRCHRLAEEWPLDDVLTLDLDRPDEASAIIVEAAAARPVAAVVPTDEPTALIAAMASRALGLPHNPVEAAAATRNKRRLREALAAAGVPTPRFAVRGIDGDSFAAAASAEYPCVLKPLLLSASRGVMRADDPESFVRAFARLRRMLDCRELIDLDPEAIASRQVLVEQFVSGPEVALEGLVDDGRLRTLALFDKPDPLDGPYFEETYYVTPSRLPEATQRAIARVTEAGARALGLRHGPLHAELRLGPDGPVVIEIAARSIGGLCSRTLRFGTGMSLEEVILRHALGRDLPTLERERRAAGVLMLPIPAAGVLMDIRGVDAARAVDGIEEVAITTRLGETLVPLPEGASYLGFVFARGDRPDAVEAALRAAHAHLSFEIRPKLA